jgi:hypothetical protein
MSYRSNANTRRGAGTPSWINAAAISVLILVFVTGVVIAVRFKPMTVIMNSLALSGQPENHSHVPGAYTTPEDKVRDSTVAKTMALSR